MGLIRREIHKAGINKLADQLRAIAHPARLALLQRIAQSNDCICTDLSKEMRLAQATISQHLKVLKEIGIIKGTIEGNSVCYCIDEKFLRSFKSDFMELFEDLESACCSDKC